MKKYLVISLILLLAFLTYLAVYIENEYGFTLSSKETVEKSPNTSNTVDIPRSDAKKISDIYMGEIKNIESMHSDNRAAARSHQNELNTLEYSDNWCTQKQLSVQDRLFADKEVNEWKVSVGRLDFGSKTESGHSTFMDSPHQKPYINLSKDKLSQFVLEEQPFAMFAALDRDDFKMEEQYQIAQNLLKLGYTGKAIQTLVMYELVKADVKFSTTGEALTSEVKQHLKNAVLYSAYSLSLNDAIGFIQLFNMIENSSPLNPSYVLTKADVAEIHKLSKELRENVDASMIEKGFSRDSDEQTNKIANYALNRDIGTLYGIYPESMNVFESRFGDTFIDLKMNDCRMKHSQMFIRK